ncbi:MAG: endonuclease/exonuclease/phosphatase family protein [Mobilicoccus sp.]|nr:endonuclease/exonuclease/phosphatase family protein [Mobilicoccus sp.]
MARAAKRFLVALTVIGVVCAPLPYIDADGLLPLVQATLPVVGLLGTLVALAALATRMPLTALVAALAAGALLVPALPLTPRPAVPEATAHGSDVTVLALNAEYGQADPSEVVDAVRSLDVDVLVLTEATPDFWRALGTHDIAALLPHATGVANPTASGTIVLTREAVTCLDPRLDCGEVAQDVRPLDEPFHQVDVRLGNGTVLRGAHPFPPTPGRGALWRVSMNRLHTFVHDTHGGAPLIVAGDLNAGPVHPVFRGVMDGLVQAPRRLPWQPTWPREASIPPFVQIDHVLARGYAVADEGVVHVGGTDHAGVWARLRPTG